MLTVFFMFLGIYAGMGTLGDGYNPHRDALDQNIKTCDVLVKVLTWPIGREVLKSFSSLIIFSVFWSMFALIFLSTTIDICRPLIRKYLKMRAARDGFWGRRI